MRAIEVAVTRGPAVESRHRVHAVLCDAGGNVRLAFGDPDLPVFPRSSLKPLQALRTVAEGAAERFGLAEPELAVMAASHQAEAYHVAAVRTILERIGASEADLFCGPHAPAFGPAAAALVREGREPTPIHNNCSGKHAGMLTLARLLGAPLSGYQQPEHPVQQAIQEVLAQTCGVDRERLQWGVDGCGVPTYRMTLRELARGLAAIAGGALPASLRVGGERLAAAMVRHPQYVGGTGNFTSELMAAAGTALVAKGGAEGVFVVGTRADGLGLAVKVEDGNARAVPPVVIAVLREAGALATDVGAKLERFARPRVLNTRGAVVGEVLVEMPSSCHAAEDGER